MLCAEIASIGADYDVFVTNFNVNGTALEYSTTQVEEGTITVQALLWWIRRAAQSQAALAEQPTAMPEVVLKFYHSRIIIRL